MAFGEVPAVIGDIGIWAGAVVSVGALLAALWRMLRRTGKAIVHEVDEHMTTLIDDRLRPILAEIHPNGGSSMKDVITATAQLAASTAETTERLAHRVELIEVHLSIPRRNE